MSGCVSRPAAETAPGTGVRFPGAASDPDGIRTEQSPQWLRRPRRGNGQLHGRRNAGWKVGARILYADDMMSVSLFKARPSALRAASALGSPSMKAIWR